MRLSPPPHRGSAAARGPGGPDAVPVNGSRALAPELMATASAERLKTGRSHKALSTEECAAGPGPCSPPGARPPCRPGKPSTSGDPAASSIPAPTQQALRTLEWITRRKNLVVRGPPAPGRPPSSKLAASRPSKAGSECLVQARGPRRLDPPQMHRPPTRRPAPSMPCCRGTRPIGGPLPCRSASPTWNTVFLWPFRPVA